MILDLLIMTKLITMYKILILLGLFGLIVSCSKDRKPTREELEAEEEIKLTGGYKSKCYYSDSLIYHKDKRDF